jgi:hypothetical protein
MSELEVKEHLLKAESVRGLRQNEKEDVIVRVLRCRFSTR